MKIFRIVVFALIFICAVFLAFFGMKNYLNADRANISSSQKSIAGVAGVGGNFEAVFTNGTPITQEDLKGRPHVMFFGFTHCPDVCPTTLYEAGQWLEALGEDGNKLDVYFVSIDPERDTAPVLAEYLTAFDKRIKGITGSVEQINRMVKKWHVFVEKDGGGEDYNVNHTATTFLMNSKGEFVRTISYGEDNKVAITKLRKLIAEEK